MFRGFNSSQLFMLHVTITAIATWSGLFNRAFCNNVTTLTLEHCHATVSPIASLTQHSLDFKMDLAKKNEDVKNGLSGWFSVIFFTVSVLCVFSLSRNMTF